MKVHALWVTAVALCLAACGKQEPAEPQQPENEPAAAPPPAEETTVAKAEFDQAFVDHMHAHAEHVDELMYALADGDFDGAMTPAYWLSQHDVVAGVPEEWRQYLSGMREAASAVESASDLEAARIAAENISTECQGCHELAGVSTPE